MEEDKPRAIELAMTSLKIRIGKSYLFVSLKFWLESYGIATMVACGGDRRVVQDFLLDLDAPLFIFPFFLFNEVETKTKYRRMTHTCGNRVCLEIVNWYSQSWGFVITFPYR